MFTCYFGMMFMLWGNLNMCSDICPLLVSHCNCLKVLYNFWIVRQLITLVYNLTPQTQPIFLPMFLFFFLLVNFATNFDICKPCSPTIAYILNLDLREVHVLKSNSPFSKPTPRGRSLSIHRPKLHHPGIT